MDSPTEKFNIATPPASDEESEATLTECPVQQDTDKQDESTCTGDWSQSDKAAYKLVGSAMQTTSHGITNDHNATEGPLVEETEEDHNFHMATTWMDLAARSLRQKRETRAMLNMMQWQMPRLSKCIQ